MSVLSDLSGKIVLVTGASRGIGQAIAQSLGCRGAIILGTATTEKGAASMTSVFREQGIEGRGYVLDVSKVTSIETSLLTMRQDFGAPHILVNNAGITRDALILRMSDEQWMEVLATNLSGAFFLTRACLKAMLKKRWGRIVNIASVVGSTGNPGQSNYVAAKSGLMGLTKSIALEYARYGITANTIAPGFIQTEMTDHLSEDQKAAILARIPMQRLGAGADIVHAVLYLVAEGAGYITGETLHINGGMYMV